jgi:hypothetical protein
MLHRIVMDVIAMTLQVALVLDAVFPEATLSLGNAFA